MEKITPKKQVFNKKRLIIIALSVTFIVMLATIIFLLIRLNAPKQSKKNQRPTVVTSGNAEQVKNLMDKPVEDGSYRVVMNIDWTFKGNASNAYVENAKDNTRTVYFDVFIAETKELVYSSPYIPVGEKLQGFTLDADLEPGNYNGLVTYHLVDDNMEEVSDLSIKVTFEIK
jgi:flagellar basal body-associated protein FliL